MLAGGSLLFVYGIADRAARGLATRADPGKVKHLPLTKDRCLERGQNSNTVFELRPSEDQDVGRDSRSPKDLVGDATPLESDDYLALAPDNTIYVIEHNNYNAGTVFRFAADGTLVSTKADLSSRPNLKIAAFFPTSFGLPAAG